MSSVLDLAGAGGGGLHPHSLSLSYDSAQSAWTADDSNRQAPVHSQRWTQWFARQRYYQGVYKSNQTNFHNTL